MTTDTTRTPLDAPLLGAQRKAPMTVGTPTTPLPLPVLEHPALMAGGTPSSSFTRLAIGNLALWFSYDSCVAFSHSGYRFGDRTVVQNRWSTTTAKHLNAIDGGAVADRLPREQFDAALSAVLAGGVA